MSTSAFARYRNVAWPYRFAGTLRVTRICGGVPSDPNVAETWLKAKLGVADETVLQRQVAEVMAERGVALDEAIADVNRNRYLTGFKRDDQGIYIEGRQIKAAIKEATEIAVASGKIEQKGWGTTRKWIKAFTAEHICVIEDRIHLGVTEPTGISQRFVHSRFGSSLQYQEYVDDVDIHFTVTTDYEFSEQHWAMTWLTGEQQGLGATRSQGYGRYTVTRWEAL